MKPEHFVTQYVERDPVTGEARLIDVPAAEWPAWTAELRRASVEPVKPRPAAFRTRAKGWWKRRFGRPIQITDLRPEALSNLAWILADAARGMKEGELRYVGGGIGLITRGERGFYLTADLTVEDRP